MNKIATHNSCTGEKPVWWSYLLIPFARCQSKTIKEQYDAGCRMFDIRIRKINNKWRVAHGLFVISRYAEDIISEINSFGDCYISVMYEGKCKDTNEFASYIEQLKEKYSNIIWGSVTIKTGYNGNLIEPSDKWTNITYSSNYTVLNGSSWHTYLPIPWLWNKLYTSKHEFNETTFICVDFL